MNRRDFLAQTAGAVVAATVAPLLPIAPVVRFPLADLDWGPVVEPPLWAVWHRGGCEGVAFWIKEDHDILNAASIVYDDGRTLTDDDGTGTTGTLLTCQACEQPGGIFSILSTANDSAQR